METVGSIFDKLIILEKRQSQLLKAEDVDKDIYNVGDNVEVSFYNPTGARIWIGVYPASSDPSNLQQGSTAAWSW